MLKFPVKGETVTIRSSRAIPMERTKAERETRKFKQISVKITAVLQNPEEVHKEKRFPMDSGS
ncbi:hypothetical protein Tco_0621413, partial [Tanacetum coccineum]